MKTLLFTNTNGIVNVEYLTDLIGSDQDAFTIQHERGVSEAEIAIGLGFQKVEQSYADVLAFAKAKNLTMTVIDDDLAGTKTEVNTATPLDITSEGALVGGVHGVARIETLSIPATASATQGDYVILTNADGETLAVWLDLNASGVEPTGALYVAADYTQVAAIVTGGTAIANGAIVKAAIDAQIGFGITVVDGEDGDLACTWDEQALAATSVPKDDDDAGAGSITVSEDTAGVDITAYSDTVETEGGTGALTFSITTGTLPVGLSIDERTGVISGNPTTAGVVTFTVTAADAFEESTTEELDITIAAP